MIVHSIIFTKGYTPITEEHGAHASMLMDFGILRLSSGEVYECAQGKERAFLLMEGSVVFQWAKEERKAARGSLLDEAPFVLHVSAEEKISIRALSDVELCVQKKENPQKFDPVFYEQDKVRSQNFGENTMQDTSTRVVRTVFDASNAPYSAMVLGEVVNYPGKWSSYPPHTHAQPEIYHYRFPGSPQGFGYGETGEQVFKIRHQATLMIPPSVTHPQCAAPGYPMYYIWMIPHLPHDKFGPDSRNFETRHEWLLDPKAEIWPDKAQR